MKWYNIFNKVGSTGSLNCPNCDYKYAQESFYFLEPRNCLSCSTELIIFSLVGVHKYIYTIDLNRAPHIFKVVANYLAEQNNEQGYAELKELILLFAEKDSNFKAILPYG